MASEQINFYMETDPNTSLLDTKKQIVTSLNEHEDKSVFYKPRDKRKLRVDSSNKSYVFYTKPIEDMSMHELRPLDQGFNMVFYSPPYFCLEKYPDDGSNTQSHIRYAHLGNWLEGFLYPSIQQSYKALSDNGLFVINIGKALTYDIPKLFLKYMEMPEVSRQFIPTSANKLYYGHKSFQMFLFQKFKNVDLCLLNNANQKTQETEEDINFSYIKDNGHTLFSVGPNLMNISKQEKHLDTKGLLPTP